MARRRAARTLGVVAATLAVGSAAVLVPLWGSSAAATGRASGIGFARVPASFGAYRFDVVVPQLEGVGAAAVAADASLRASAQSLVGRWVPWLRRHETCPPRARRCGPGRFEVHARAGGISASPRLVDALLDLDVTCPGCARTQAWSSEGALLPTGAAVNVFDLLFAHHPAALRRVAEVIRLEVSEDPGTNRCVSDVWNHLAERTASTHLARWLALLRRHRAVALERGGLLVGFDPGDYADRACGLSTFLVPYEYFAGLLGTAGQVLVDSFVFETYNPPLRYALPVRVCASSYAVGPYGGHRRLPRRLTVVVPGWLVGRAAVYIDTHEYLRLVAPAGWRCTVGFSGDGSAWMDVYPPSERAPQDLYDRFPPRRSARQGVSLVAVSACVSCLLQLTCPYFASARREWNATYGGVHPYPCARFRDEHVERLSATIVRVVDPPGVVGGNWPSGGADTALGDAGFGDARGGGSYLETCTIPAADAALCDAVLGWYEANDGWAT